MKTTTKKRKGDTSELIFYISLIALPILQVLIFYFYVNINSFTMSFKTYDTLKDKFEWAGLVNSERLWYELTETTIIKDAFINSVVVWLCTSVLCTFLCILFSYYIYKKWVLAKTFKFFLFLPSVLPGILLVIVYKFFANEALPGYIAEIFGKTVDPLLIGQKTLMPTLLFFCVFMGFGGQLLIYTGAMGQIAPEIIEAGQVDGVSAPREFFSIVLPMILPTISTFLVAQIAGLFTNQASLYSFFMDKAEFENYTIGYYLFVLVNGTGYGKTMYTYASALGLVCTFIAFPLTLLARHFLNKKEGN
jgi:ABC-type sugar transport system permease subunit